MKRNLHARCSGRNRENDFIPQHWRHPVYKFVSRSQSFRNKTLHLGHRSRNLYLWYLSKDVADVFIIGAARHKEPSGPVRERFEQGEKMLPFIPSFTSINSVDDYKNPPTLIAQGN